MSTLQEIEQAIERLSERERLELRAWMDSLSPSLQPSKPKLSGEEWAQAFRELAASHPRTTHFVDDSRESIYEGRGE
jgi:hypothetical protein